MFRHNYFPFKYIHSPNTAHLLSVIGIKDTLPKCIILSYSLVASLKRDKSIHKETNCSSGKLCFQREQILSFNGIPKFRKAPDTRKDSTKSLPDYENGIGKKIWLKGNGYTWLIFAIISKENSFYGILLNFLYTKPFLRRVSSKRKLFLHQEQIRSFRLG